jgi:Rod binding domain-containing protein
MSPPTVSTHRPPTDAQILRHAHTRRAAEQFIGQTFFVPLFKQMRSSPFKSELFSGGRGGEVFESMLDGLLAERMGASAGSKLVDALVARIDPHTTQAMKSARAPIPTPPPPRLDLTA